MHVGDLDDVSTRSSKNWAGRIAVTVHTNLEGVVAGATVTGSWSNGLSGTSTCTTNAVGTCEVTKNAKLRVGGATFRVTGVRHASLSYVAGANHDVDGGSNGTSIAVSRPA